MKPSSTIDHDGWCRACGRGGKMMPARAQLTIDTTRPSFELVPTAIVDFKGDAGGRADGGGGDPQRPAELRPVPRGSRQAPAIQQNVDATSPPQFSELAPGRCGRSRRRSRSFSSGGNIKV